MNLKTRKQRTTGPKKPARKRVAVLTQGKSGAEKENDRRYLLLRQHAFLALREAKKRKDQSFLNEIAAYAKSPHDLPAGFLRGEGRGRKVSPNRELVKLLGKVETGPDGSIRNIKSILTTPDLSKQYHTELVRFCSNLARDLEFESNPWPVASRYGFRRTSDLVVLRKAWRIGRRYAGSTMPTKL